MPNNRMPGDLSLLGRLGAYSQHAKHDVRETTRAARAARDQKFIEEVDPQRRCSSIPATERADGWWRPARPTSPGFHYSVRKPVVLGGPRARRPKTAGHDPPPRTHRPRGG